MIEITDITHHIQRHILSVLYHKKSVRFRDMRPPKVDTNLYSYHLKLLLRQEVVKKTESGYTLAQKGLAYIDRVSTKNMMVRTQPKIVTMLVVQNSEGCVLVQFRTKQPHVETWTLPYGKLHIEDESIAAAAKREAQEKIGSIDAPVEHAGDCYIRVLMNGNILSSTLVHVFRFESNDIKETETLRWVKPHKLSELTLAPAVEQIVARTFFRDPYFFEEFTVEIVE